MRRVADCGNIPGPGCDVLGILLVVAGVILGSFTDSLRMLIRGSGAGKRESAATVSRRLRGGGRDRGGEAPRFSCCRISAMTALEGAQTGTLPEPGKFVHAIVLRRHPTVVPDNVGRQDLRADAS